MLAKILIIFLAFSEIFGEDYYELLGLKRDADQKAIRQAFKKLAVTLHPDKNNEDPEAHEKFVKYTTAYEVLKDPDTRKKYDLYGEEGVNGQNNQRSQQNYHSWSYYQNNFGIYDDDPQIVTLNKNDYHDNVIQSEKVWMVNFYSAACSHCHHLAPIWRRIAKDLEGIIRIGAVNCEDDWSLCQELGIQSYPTLLYYPKNSKHGIRFTSKKTYDLILKFVMDRLDVNIENIRPSVWTRLIKGLDSREKSLLIFTCGKNRYCFNNDDQIKTAAILENISSVGEVDCDAAECDKILSSRTTAVFLPGTNHEPRTPVFFEEVESVSSLIHEILENLPEPQEVTPNGFEDIKKRLETESEDGWLLCFYMGHATEFDLQLKRLPSIIHDVKLGKVNCGKYSKFCNEMNINRYPMWGVLKPGGAFELSHGKDNINDIAKFAENSMRAKNVWALSAEKIRSILKRQSGSEVWFVDWYAPWCPPCIQFLPEVRKASLDFEKSTIRFGTVDCTVHSAICREYNIRSYPTAMLINGSRTSQFTLQKTAANIIEFIKESINPTVTKLNVKNFHQTIGRKNPKVLWAVDYFAPWCGPCQQLAPEWTKVAKVLQSIPNIKIASVDCEENSDLCGSQNVRSYPTIRLYPFGSAGLDKVILYNGNRDANSLLKWISHFLPTKVKELNDNALEKNVYNSKKDIWLVDYFAPWCGHCQVLEPQFNVAAQLLEGKVKLGRVNCDVMRSECTRAGVRGYPTLMIYNPKEKRGNKIEGKRISASTAEEIKNEVLHYLNSKYGHDEL